MSRGPDWVHDTLVDAIVTEDDIIDDRDTIEIPPDVLARALAESEPPPTVRVHSSTHALTRPDHGH